MAAQGSVIITGASSGIGAALARLYAQQGRRVGMLARRESKLSQLAAELATSGAYRICDVTNRSATAQAIGELEVELGPCELLIANAGISGYNSADRLDPDLARRVYDVNVFGCLNAMAAVIPGMKERRHGQLVGVSSIASVQALPGAAHYCASKAALNTQLDGLRSELKPMGIGVTNILPGFIHTEMTADQTFLPMVMSADKAAIKISRAIARGKSNYTFPRPIYAALKLVSWLPQPIKRRAIHLGS